MGGLGPAWTRRSRPAWAAHDDCCRVGGGCEHAPRRVHAALLPSVLTAATCPWSASTSPCFWQLVSSFHPCGPCDPLCSYLPLAHIYERFNFTLATHFGAGAGFYRCAGWLAAPAICWCCSTTHVRDGPAAICDVCIHQAHPQAATRGQARWTCWGHQELPLCVRHTNRPS